MDRLKEYQHNPPTTTTATTPLLKETNPNRANKRRKSTSQVGELSIVDGQSHTSEQEDHQLQHHSDEQSPSTSQCLHSRSLIPDDSEDGDDVGHYGVIFDDMNFKHLHREAQLAICDVYDDTDIHIRYSVAHLPAGTPRILTTNLHPSDVMLATDPAIKRRLQVIEVHCDLSETPRRMIYFPIKL